MPASHANTPLRVRTLRVLEAKVMVMVNMMSRCLDLIARLLCMCMHYINTEQLVLCNIRGKPKYYTLWENCPWLAYYAWVHVHVFYLQII